MNKVEKFFSDQAGRVFVIDVEMAKIIYFVSLAVKKNNPELSNVLEVVLNSSCTFVGREFWSFINNPALEPDGKSAASVLQSLFW